MPELTDESELDAYYMQKPLHDRAAAIMWPIILEKRIDSLFELALRPDDEVKRALFQPSGALGAYAVKVRLAYLLGWMGEDIYKDLITISKIRNRFAHNIDVHDFNDERVASWLANLRGSALLPEMLKKAEEEAEGEKRESKERAGEIPAKTGFEAFGKRLTRDILQDMSEDPRLRLRWCIDLMIWQLDRFAANMKNNLSALPGSWIIGDDKPDRFRTTTSTSQTSEHEPEVSRSGSS